MDIFANLITGFEVALTPLNLVFVILGITVGMIFGAFPGLGAPTAIALLLPLTFTLNPTSAIIMLAGIYYGSQYGNTITAVLLGIPGDSAAVVTALDGYQLALKGRAGYALSVAAVGSFVAGTLGTIVLMVAAPALAAFALRFGPPEYFAVILFAFATLPAFAGESRAKLFVALAAGIVLATVGLDDFTSRPRFTFGFSELFSGISFVPAIIGLFGIGDVFYAAGQPTVPLRLGRFRARDLMPPLDEWLRVKWSIVRGSVLGFLVGTLPGAGATIASFMAYALERSVSKRPGEFGKGMLEGVAAPESANNGATAGAFVPLLTLGVPGSGATAIMLGGFIMWGLQPGPLLFQNNPQFVWGLIASMYIGNVALLLVNVTMVPLFARILLVPYSVLTPLIVVFCAVGAYSLNGSMTDVWLMFAFGLLGYVMRVLGVPTAPMILGLVLGPLVEAKLRQSLTVSTSGLWVFVERPISATMLALAVLAFFGPPLLAAFRRPRAVSG